MATYAPLHCHSYYSLLDGLPSPKAIVQRCVDLELPACAITDHGNIAGLKAFHDACAKRGVQPIIGVELYVCEQDARIQTRANGERHHLILLAKGDRGIKTLIQLSSETNRPDYFYRKPRIHLEGIRAFAARGDLIALSACVVGQLSAVLFTDFKAACRVHSVAEAESLLQPDWRERAIRVADRYLSVFGAENYYVELQDEGMPIQAVATRCLREIADALKLKTVSSLDAHYCTQQDAIDQRILLFSQMHTTQEQQEQILQAGGDTMVFFHSDQYYIYSAEEMLAKFTADEVARTLEIAEKVGKTTVGASPRLPKFTNDEMASLNMTPDQYLRHLCIEGGKRKLTHLTREQKRPYWARLKRELAILAEARLADYFLIEWDACRFADEQGVLRGKGRGSGAGCVVNYLLNITDIDPLLYDLVFERFYNAARNIPPHFDVGTPDFMTWYGENFEAGMNPTWKDDVRRLLRRRPLNNERLLAAEAAWIDENNPRMWGYLLAQGQQRGCENPHNSHIAYAMGVTERLDGEMGHRPVAGHISLPDIDVDVPMAFREKMITYLAERWGQDHVVQMVTFGRLQGRAALKEVFRAQPGLVRQMLKAKALNEGNDPEDLDVRPHDICNEITAFMPDEAAVADELQQMRDATGNENYGVLQWSIENVPEVAEAYQQFKPLFDQAMRIEGTKKSQGKHAAGVVIADCPVSELVPLIYDPHSKLRVCGVEMGIAEKMGAVKFDFLGVTALDKLAYAAQLVNGGPQGLGLDDDSMAEGDDDD